MVNANSASTFASTNQCDWRPSSRQRTSRTMRIRSGVACIIASVGLAGCLKPATCFELLACSLDDRDAGMHPSDGGDAEAGTSNDIDGDSFATQGTDAAVSSGAATTLIGNDGGSPEVSRPSDAGVFSTMGEGGVGPDAAVDASDNRSGGGLADGGASEPDSAVATCADGYRLVGESCELVPRVQVGGGFYLNGAAGHTCVVARNGDVSCWGDNRAGQCGVADQDAVADEDGEEASRVHLPASAVSVALGAETTCALANDGRVFRLGQPSRGDVQEVTLDGRAVALGAGAGFGCALLEDGGVWCWGANTYGATGQGKANGDTELPGRVSGLDPVSQLAVGDKHVCVLQVEGEVQCWGRGIRGALGADIDALMDESGEVPNQVSLPRPAVKVAAGVAVTCAILDDRSVWCWGVSSANGSSVDSPLPIQIALPDSAVDVAVSGIGCATLASDEVHCWGMPYWDSKAAVPDGNSWRVDLGSDAPTHVSLSPVHMCITLASDRVRCWGTGGWGELGIPSEDVTEAPVTTRIVGY